MQVDIITFHFVPNQGAVLQCCALKLFLEKKGHSVAVIDYRPQYHTVRYSKHRNPFIYAEWYWKKYKKSSLLNKTRIYCQSFLRAICLNIKKSENKTLDAFEVFVSRHIPLTTRYTSLKQLQDNPPIADAYVGGSDQLWNPELLDQEFDQAYFLNFGKDTTARVSYAVSMGKIQDSNYLKELNWYCKPLTAVSLREYNAETIEAIGRDVHICIDPTLLLDDNDYEPMESNNIESKPYIFVYGFEDTNEIHEAIGMAQNRYNCEIINGSPHRIMYENSRKIRDFGPDRFLSFIKNAQCVVTNSFHGTAFSIIYRKDFITVSHSTRGRRMIELLGKLNLNHRLWGTEEFSFTAPIDWETVYGKLNIMRKHSCEYLLSAIQGISGENIPHWDEEYI